MNDWKGLICVTATLLTATAVHAANVTQYNDDKAGWEAAASLGNLLVQTETFDSATPGDLVTSFTSSVIASYQSSYSGLSFVDTGSGDVAVSDRVSTFMDLPTAYAGGEGRLQTLIVLESSAYGFGADWSEAGGSGNLGVAVLMNKTTMVGTITPTAGGAFWGFQSDMAFDRILLIAGYNPNPQGAPRMNFLLDDVVVAADLPSAAPIAPAPGALAGGLALLGLGVLRRR
ncbi:MAG: hypothetical protein RIG82_04130 [Phycisphaeraceae bacterium]